MTPTVLALLPSTLQMILRLPGVSESEEKGVCSHCHGFVLHGRKLVSPEPDRVLHCDWLSLIPFVFQNELNPAVNMDSITFKPAHFDKTLITFQHIDPKHVTDIDYIVKLIVH